MIQELACRSVSSQQRFGLAAKLRVAPWIWPQESDSAGLAWAEGVAEGTCPAPGIGHVPIVTDSRWGTHLWVLGGPELQEAGLGEPVEWARDAAEAWDEAVLAVARALPVLWTTMTPVADEPPRAYHLAGHPRAHANAEPESTLGGRSFGGAFVLNIVSRLFERPVPVELIASVDIDANGAAAAVDAVAEKVRAIAATAPRIRRIVLPARQPSWARPPDLAVAIGNARCAADLVDLAFGDALVDRLVAAGRDPEQRRELIERIFRLVVARRGEVVYWKPVEAAASLALCRWKDSLDEPSRYALRFTSAVAGRHEHGLGPLELPPQGWLEGFPAEMRTSLVANLVQHVADTGTPDPHRVVEMAQGHLVEPREATPAQRKVVGALARLYAVTGRHTEALQMQEALATASADSFDEENVSHPLAEWFRLSGDCWAVDAFKRADRLLAHLRLHGGLDRVGASFVDLARCRATVVLALPRREETRRCLDRLNSPARQTHVRWSSVRWHVRLLDATGDTDDGIAAEALITDLEREIAHHPERNLQPRIFRTLIALDRALASGNAEEAELAVRTLESLRGGPVLRLIESSPPGVTPAQHVARFYPY